MYIRDLGDFVSIEEQITAALTGRAAQRPFADDLSSNWDRLTNSFTVLASSAAELARAASTTSPPDARHAAIFSDLDRYLAGSADSQQRAAALRNRLYESPGNGRLPRAHQHGQAPPPPF